MVGTTHGTGFNDTAKKPPKVVAKKPANKVTVAKKPANTVGVAKKPANKVGVAKRPANKVGVAKKPANEVSGANKRGFLAKWATPNVVANKPDFLAEWATIKKPAAATALKKPAFMERPLGWLLTSIHCGVCSTVLGPAADVRCGQCLGTRQPRGFNWAPCFLSAPTSRRAHLEDAVGNPLWREKMRKALDDLEQKPPNEPPSSMTSSLDPDQATGDPPEPSPPDGNDPRFLCRACPGSGARGLGHPFCNSCPECWQWQTARIKWLELKWARAREDSRKRGAGMTSESRAPAPGPEPSSSGVQETSLERSDSASEDATEGKTKASGQGRNGASGNGCNPMFCPFCDDRLAATDSQGVVPLSERPVFRATHLRVCQPCYRQGKPHTMGACQRCARNAPCRECGDINGEPFLLDPKADTDEERDGDLNFKDVREHPPRFCPGARTMRQLPHIWKEEKGWFSTSFLCCTGCGDHQPRPRWLYDVVFVYGGTSTQGRMCAPPVIERYKHKLCVKCAVSVLHSLQRIKTASCEPGLTELRISPTELPSAKCELESDQGGRRIGPE